MAAALKSSTRTPTAPTQCKFCSYQPGMDPITTPEGPRTRDGPHVSCAAAAQGALLGPMIVAALAVTFDLHVTFIGAELPRTTQATPSLSRTTSVASREASVESRLQGGQH